MLFHHSNDIAKLSQLNCSSIQLYWAEIGFIVAFSSHPHTQPPTQRATHPWKCISATIKTVEDEFGSQIIWNMNWGWFCNCLGSII